MRKYTASSRRFQEDQDLKNQINKANESEKRLVWKTYKAFPQLLPVKDFNDLTPEQQLEMYAHQLIDKGARICPKCDEINTGFFCSVCGEQLGGEIVECEFCKKEYEHNEKMVYCEICGSIIGETEFERKMKEGLITPDDIEVEPLDRDYAIELYYKLHCNEMDDEITV